MWQFVNGAKLIIQQTTHKLVYYGQSQFYVEFKHGHENKHILVTYLIVSLQKQYIIIIFYHSKMYGALVQGIKQDDFKLRLEDNFDV